MMVWLLSLCLPHTKYLISSCTNKETVLQYVLHAMAPSVSQWHPGTWSPQGSLHSRTPCREWGRPVNSGGKRSGTLQGVLFQTINCHVTREACSSAKYSIFMYQCSLTSLVEVNWISSSFKILYVFRYHEINHLKLFFGNNWQQGLASWKYNSWLVFKVSF